MVEKITPAEAIRLLDAGKAQAVDVREPDEFAVGHIPGAKLLPLGDVLTRAEEVMPDKNAQWLIYCRTGRAKKEGVSYLFYVPEEKKRVQELLRLTRNTDLCTPVHFDFNHEHIVVEEKKDSADRFQIKCYF